MSGTELERARVSIRLQPRARANEIVGERGGALVVKVTAPPVDGKANAAVFPVPVWAPA